MKTEEFISKIASSGVVGAGGGGFPAAVKISAKFDHYIANAAECEPLIHKDVEILLHKHMEVVEAIAAVRENSGARKAYFALKRKYDALWNAISADLSTHGIIPLFLEDVYPAGDEFEIVFNALGKVVPAAAIPLTVNVAVNNVETLLNIHNAMRDIPVTEKWLTVTGEVRFPFTAAVPIGTPVSFLIKYAQPKIQDFAIVEGGPMMGTLVLPDEPVKKTTSGFIILPREHVLVHKREMPMRYMLRIAASACMQCQACTDLCPRHLLGHPLEPHKIMRSLAMPLSMPADMMTGALICSECGVCELYACPMGLLPRRLNRELKEKFARSGVRYESKISKYSPPEERDFRKIPSFRLIERLQISKYASISPEYIEKFPKPDMVVLPLKQHAGVAASPIVANGQEVIVGQKIADIPTGKLGAPIHASIDGIAILAGDRIVIKP